METAARASDDSRLAVARAPSSGLLVVLALVLPVAILWSATVGVTGSLGWGDTWRGVLAACGWGEPLNGTRQTIVELRLWRALTTAGVGGALALSGAYVQGLFRNGLAAPSILGVTSGASLGAVIAILLLAGYGPSLLLTEDLGRATYVIPLFGAVGAIGAVSIVVALGSPGGRVSVPTLLLTGIAVNTCIGGVLSLISWLVLADWDVSRSILSWTFGTLDDRTAAHALTVWGGLAIAAAAAPFVAWELDLVQTGERDARALGVATTRVRVIVVIASSLAAASAVAVAGQIAFVGLVVPHMVRLTGTTSHRRLLPASLLGGALFLVLLDTVQVLALGAAALQPGVVMSLVGGPLFLLLLLRQRQQLEEA